jgi:hypothetical protein
LRLRGLLGGASLGRLCGVIGVNVGLLGSVLVIGRGVDPSVGTGHFGTRRGIGLGRR